MTTDTLSADDGMRFYIVVDWQNNIWFAERVPVKDTAMRSIELQNSALYAEAIPLDDVPRVMGIILGHWRGSIARPLRCLSDDYLTDNMLKVINVKKPNA